MSRFNSGWIKLHRSAADSDLHQNGYLWSIWTTLLVWATRQETKVIFNLERRAIPSGSVVFAIDEIAKRLGFARPTVTKWLKYLHRTDRIILEISSKGCIATIPNWKLYQAHDYDACIDVNNQAATKLQPSCNQVALIGEVKNLRIKEEREKVSPDSINPCIEAWGKTLARMGIDKDPKLDAAAIAQLLARHGFEKTKMALLGAAFEETSKDYNPKKHVSIRRLLKPDIFESFVNLGAQNKEKIVTEVEWGL